MQLRFFYSSPFFNLICYQTFYSYELKGSLYDLQLLANSERLSKSLVFVYVLNNIDVACEMHSVIHST